MTETKSHVNDVKLSETSRMLFICTPNTMPSCLCSFSILNLYIQPHHKSIQTSKLSIYLYIYKNIGSMRIVIQLIIYIFYTHIRKCFEFTDFRKLLYCCSNNIFQLRLELLPRTYLLEEIVLTFDQLESKNVI